MTYAFGYVNVPVLVTIKPLPGLTFLAGPQVGINVSKKAKSEGVSFSGSALDDLLETASAKVSPLDFAAVVGVQYTFLGHLNVGARYNIGLTPAIGLSDAAKDAGDSVSGGGNRVIQVSAGWFF